MHTTDIEQLRRSMRQLLEAAAESTNPEFIHSCLRQVRQMNATFKKATAGLPR